MDNSELQQDLEYSKQQMSESMSELERLRIDHGELNQEFDMITSKHDALTTER